MEMEIVLDLPLFDVLLSTSPFTEPIQGGVAAPGHHLTCKVCLYFVTFISVGGYGSSEANLASGLHHEGDVGMFLKKSCLKASFVTFGLYAKLS